MSQSSPSAQGVLLIAILLNAYLFGLVSQQFHGYWVSRFKDTIYLKLFIIVQYLLVALQSILIWQLAYGVFVLSSFLPPSSQPSLWQGPVNSICQLIIVLLANVFLAIRIHGLTHSFVQSGLVVVLSTSAFVIGMVTVVLAWKTTCPAVETTSIIWHSIQAAAECFITFFLVRTLRGSRSGMRRSDTVVNHIVRSTIQTGCFATVWAIAGLVTWFFLPRVMAFRLFDLTSGSIYTHAIFDTLLSRVHLRERMLSSTFELGWTTQDGTKRSSRTSGGFRRSLSAQRVRNLALASLDTSQPESGPSDKCAPIESQTLHTETSS
ncbi:hypothetical protein BJV74DRAFT_129920 [Russula compacta]|nr:hypothetical protein BJV74DRAFT_129920 [Russula compacta]